MRFSSIKERLAGLGGAKWEVHARARALAREGRDIIQLTIGEPDVATPDSLKKAAYAGMCAGRTGYSDGQGEPGLRPQYGPLPHRLPNWWLRRPRQFPRYFRPTPVKP